MGKSIILRQNKNATQRIGIIPNEITSTLNLPDRSEQIVIYPSAILHIKKRHPHAFKLYFQKIPEVIQSPDFIGVSGESPKRIELIKKYKETILVALKFDEDNNLVVSSMYIIEEHRVQKRLEYGRLAAVK